MPDNSEIFQVLSVIYGDLFSTYIREFFSSTKLPDKTGSASTPSTEIRDVPIAIFEQSIINSSKERLLRDFLRSYQSTQTFITDPISLKNLIDIRECEKEFANTLLHLIHEEVFEFGLENAADVFVQENLRVNPAFTKEWLNSIFLDRFSDIEVTTGLLRIIAHLKYTDIYPTGQTMALAALNHKNAEVRECGIRAFENWDDVDSLDYLKQIRCEEKWLQDYLEQVINYLEECYVSIGKKD